MVGTTDYTNPESHINGGHSKEAEELMTPKTDISLGEKISRYGTYLSIASILSSTAIWGSNMAYVRNRANNAPQIVKEYCDINPAIKELEQAIEHSKKNYLFDFNRRDFKSEAVISKLERVQIENKASQNEQLGNLSVLEERLEIRKKEIEDANPEVAQYLGRTDQVSKYFMSGQGISLQMAGLGCLMFAMPQVFSYLKRRKENKTSK